MLSPTNEQCLSVLPIEGQDRQTPQKATPLLDLARAKLQKYREQNKPEEQLFDCSEEALDVVIKWFEIALDEGHIEPSQPSAGRIVGWPVRSFNFRSLLTDFQVWCMKRNLEEVDRERDKIYKMFCEKIYHLEDDRVCFPPIDECRESFFRLKSSSYKEVSSDKFKAD